MGKTERKHVETKGGGRLDMRTTIPVVCEYPEQYPNRVSITLKLLLLLLFWKEVEQTSKKYNLSTVLNRDNMSDTMRIFLDENPFLTNASFVSA